MMRSNAGSGPSTMLFRRARAAPWRCRLLSFRTHLLFDRQIEFRPRTVTDKDRHGRPIDPRARRPHRPTYSNVTGQAPSSGPTQASNLEPPQSRLGPSVSGRCDVSSSEWGPDSTTLKRCDRVPGRGVRVVSLG